MVSGFSAAFMGPVATGPFDVIKTRLMAQSRQAPPAPGAPPPYSGFFDAFFRIGREEGAAALYKGLLPRLMRIPPGQAIVWAVSDQVTGYFEAAARRKAELAEAAGGAGALGAAPP